MSDRRATPAPLTRQDWQQLERLCRRAFEEPAIAGHDEIRGAFRTAASVSAEIVNTIYG